ncbi:MAG: ABC transporter permease [Acidimicrobiales bacterium]|nr:ABC transporter permease [Acidimicrobiales bacterium]MCB9393377.1 ABC transporter permease [Acidimicrobiaceae bacterium]
MNALPPPSGPPMGPADPANPVRPGPVPPRPAPSGSPSPGRHVGRWAATALVYRVVRRQLFSRGRLLALGLLALLVPVAAAALGANDSASVRDGVGLIANLGFAVVVPIISLVFGTAAIGDLREDKTLVYLWLRPLDRWPIALGAWLAALTIVAPLSLVPVVVAAALTGAGNGLVGATLLAGVVAVAAYLAVFTLFGTVFRRATVWGLAYILIWEGFIASGGTGVARFALRSYTRAVLREITDVRLRLADHSLVVGVVVPLVVAVAFLALTARRLGRLDVD